MEEFKHFFSGHYERTLSTQIGKEAIDYVATKLTSKDQMLDDEAVRAVLDVKPGEKLKITQEIVTSMKQYAPTFHEDNQRAA